MDLGLSEEQEMLKNFARDFLEKESPEKLVREMEEDERGYTDALWQGMAQQGWQGLMIPEEHGGNGMDSWTCASCWRSSAGRWCRGRSSAPSCWGRSPCCSPAATRRRKKS